MTVGVLMLAAGESRRFGQDKRLARLADGRSLLQASADGALASGLPVWVCLRPEDRAASELLIQPDITVLACPGAHRGMGYTLAEGVAQLPALNGVLVALADMPDIEASTYRLLAAGLEPGIICRPVYQGRGGHPVGFGSEFFSQLKALSGDQGARRILQARRAAIIDFDTGDAGVLHDIDRPGDLAQ